MAFYEEKVIEGEVVSNNEDNPQDNRDIHTLSTGVRVEFTGKLSEAISQTMVTNVFNKTQLDGRGNIRSNLSTQEQFSVANSLLNFNTGLVFSGKVKLVDGLPEDTAWLDEISLNPAILESHKNIDIDNPVHQEKLYLRYFAFSSPEDFQLLSEKLIHNG